MSLSLANIQRDPAREALLSRWRAAARIGQPVYACEQVASTMDAAHQLAADGAPEGAMVWAARQTQGRGRLGRVWVSPPGGAYLSLILRPRRPAGEHPQLSLVTGLSVAEAIQELTRLPPAIRWPNDLMIHGRKVCGILVEAASGAVIVGIGINVTTDPDKLPPTATSLSAAGPEECDPLQLTGVLCHRFEAWYDAWTREGFAPIRAALRPWMGFFGRPIRLTAGTALMEGTATDLDEAGRLLVRFDSGMIRAFEMGEVTILR